MTASTLRFTVISNSVIPLYQEIGGLYAAAGLDREPLAPDFDLLTLKPASRRKATVASLGPHRRGFFQLTYLLSADRSHDLLLAAAPEQVLKDGRYLRPDFQGQHGHTLLFKAGAVAHQLASPCNEFPFFYLPASLELPVSGEFRDRLLPQFQAIGMTATGASPYRTRRLSALLAALLYDVRGIYEQAENAAGRQQLCTALACRFDEVVLQHFQTHRTVGDYARLLHVSADHLSAEVKAKTGRNAREVIADRIVTEARHLLTYTELTVSQIADRLGFSEPTHFTRYFKRCVGESPQEFRRRVFPLADDQVGSGATAARRGAAM